MEKKPLTRWEQAKQRFFQHQLNLKESAMRKYTVIGVYDDTGQVFTESYEAKTPLEAMVKAAKKAEKAGSGSCLQIVGALAGEQVVFVPSEDSGKTSYACDMATIGG